MVIVLALEPLVGPAASASPLVFEPADPTFGVIRKNDGQPKTIQIKLRNIGADPVRIDRINLGCGCMSARLEESNPLVPPAGTARVSIFLNPLRMVRGGEKYSLTVLQDLRIVGESTVSYQYDPGIVASVPELVLSGPDEPGGQRASAVLTITRDIDVSRLKCIATGEAMQVQLMPHGNTGRQFTLDVVATAKTSFGKLSERVILYLDWPESPELVIPLRGKRDLPVSSQPTTIIIRDRVDGPVHRQLKFSSAENIAVTEISTTSPLIAVRKARPDDATEWIVTVHPDPTRDLLDEKIIVRFEYPDSFEIEIPVIGG